MSGPRLSYVTAGFPFPLSSGYLRHHHLLRALAPDHSIALRSLVGPRFDPADVDGVRGLVDDVATFADGRPGAVRGAVGRVAPSRRPAADGLRARVAVDVEEGVDAVVLSGKDTASVLGVLPPGMPLVVDLCDATSARVTQEMALAPRRRRPALALRRAALRRIEQDLVLRADVLLTASARDRDLLADEGAPARVLQALVVPNGIAGDEWARRTPHLGDAVVFCGNLGYRPNADAARHLVARVMPHVWAARPATPVTIVGTGASSALRAVLDRPQVTVTGTVDDVRPHLEAGAVFAAPLRVATGIQNKLLEALALQVPVVTSTVAAAGLGPGAPVEVADEPVAFAALVVAALDTASTRDHRPEPGLREWVTERFRWDRSGQAVAEAVRTAIDKEVARW